MPHINKEKSAESIKIIEENKDFIAINKPSGLLVYTPQNQMSTEETVVTWATKRFGEIKTVGDAPKERPGIVHRLDRGTSGVMIITRNQAFFTHLKKQFQDHKVQKTYKAIVRGNVREKGLINTPIGLIQGTTKRSTKGRKLKMVKEAITEYYPEKYNSNRDTTLVKIVPKTGRTHQIRVHLASIHHPIKGDTLYGGKKNSSERLLLHAESIEFSLPNGKRVRLEAEIPSCFIFD